MPNKKRNAKLRDKLLLSGAQFKNEHVRTTLKDLIKKSKIVNDDYEVDDYEPSNEPNDGEMINLEQKLEITEVKAPVSKEVKQVVTTKDKKDTNGKKKDSPGVINKKNKKNKYFLLAHPELKEKVKVENHGFVVTKEVVEKKFLVKEENGSNSLSNGGKNSTKKPIIGSDDDYAPLWVLEPCTSSDDEETVKESDKNKKNKKRKAEEAFSLPDIKFKTKKQTLEDGTVVETFCAVDNEPDKEVKEGDPEEEDDDEEGEEGEDEEEEDDEEQEKEVEEKKKEKNKKEKLKTTPVLSEAQQKLQASRFRYLNELLYTKKSDESFDYFKTDCDAFKAYHQGFQSQTTKWPVNPLEVIIKSIKAKSTNLVVADFGCGEAKLAQSVNNKVHSFDFVALNDLVTACDMKNVPLNEKSCDIVVFCLSLMGTNVSEFLCEAHRVLKLNGVLKVAEVASRFENVQMFIRNVESIGFKCASKEIKQGSYFYFFDFTKTSNEIRSKASLIHLSPCLYKKR